MTGMDGRVLVVGSVNVDLVVAASRLPAPGETVLGGAFSQHQGGKGANQAVAAARAGAAVTLIGAVGDDAFGAAAREALAGEGIDVRRVATRPAPTGVALIVVDAAGENQITVASGANALVVPGDVSPTALDAADVVLTGFEVPMATVVAAARGARERGVPAVVNAAPAEALPAALLAADPILVLNELELTITSRAPDLDGGLSALAARTRGPVVVTRGDRGVVVARGAERIAIAGSPADAVVDTTGAGDAFTGVLAAWLAGGESLEAAARAGSAAGALSVGRSGAREGMPRASELMAFLADHPH
jgi:ribokinase